MSMTMYTSTVLINDFFGESFVFWNSLSNLGIMAGAFTMPPVVERSLKAYGYHGAFLIMGGLALNVVACGATARSRESVEAKSIRTRPKQPRKKLPRKFHRSTELEMETLPLTEYDSVSDAHENTKIRELNEKSSSEHERSEKARKHLTSKNQTANDDLSPVLMKSRNVDVVHSATSHSDDEPCSTRTNTSPILKDPTDQDFLDGNSVHGINNKTAHGQIATAVKDSTSADSSTPVPSDSDDDPCSTSENTTLVQKEPSRILTEEAQDHWSRKREMASPEDQNHWTRKEEMASDEGGMARRIMGFLRSNVLIKEPTFSYMLLPVFLYNTVLASWTLFLVPHAIWLEIPAAYAVLLSTVGGVSGLIGQIVYLTLYHNQGDIFLFFGTCAALSAAMFFLDSLCSSFWFLSLSAAVEGFVILGSTTMPTALTKRTIVNEDNFSSALSVMFVIVSAGTMAGSMLSGT